MNKYDKIEYKSGFTLIEILIVVIIIGLLAGIATVSFSTSERRSRDARRKADIVLMRDSMNLYAIDNKGVYPTLPNFSSNLEGVAICSTIANRPGSKDNWTYLENTLAKYIQNGFLPTDPKWKCSGKDVAGGSTLDEMDYMFYIKNDGTRYSAWVQLENPKDPDRNRLPGDVWGKYSKLFGPSYYANPDGIHYINTPNLYGVGTQ